VLPLPPGLPPVSYSVSAGTYALAADGSALPVDVLDEEGNPAGRYLDVGATHVAQAAGVVGDPYGASPVLTPLGDAGDLTEHLVLVAASIDRPAAARGEQVFVILRWRASGPVPSGTLAGLRLEQGGSVLSRSESPPGGEWYPSHLWREGEEVLERRSIAVPPEAARGAASVAIDVGGRRLELGDIEITGGTALFEPPPMSHRVEVRFGDVGELLGYELSPSPHVSGQPITVTLYWRALEDAAEAHYTVFAHLLTADGHLVAQHDGAPAAGTRPTRGWIAGEIVTDVHPMAFREPYTGPAVVEVGLYDGATLDRILIEGGETAYVLPVKLAVAPN
jgi:hypothetical protein